MLATLEACMVVCSDHGSSVEKGGVMNRVLVLAGAVLLTLSLLSFALLPYSWTEETTATITTPIVDVELPARTPHSIDVPRPLSWGGAATGWLLILAGVSLGRKESNPPRG
jgi:hypothetical protein